MAWTDEWIVTAMGMRIRVRDITSYIRYPEDNFTQVTLGDHQGVVAVYASPEEIDALLGRVP